MTADIEFQDPRRSPFLWSSPMMIANVIAKAESGHVIYFLLSAYLEATQFGRNLPERLTNLPITGLQDVETRFQQLIVEFKKTSEKQRENARLEIGEALHIFNAALRRLKFLHRETRTIVGVQHLERQSLRGHAAGL
jgi:hypothetical protein